ncbi:MAG: primosomal protein N' [Armatimonadota bacterium]|nr:primosomal protein N' [Armatimonadota bacterium]
MASGCPLRVALDLPLRAGDLAFTFAGPVSDAPPGTGVVVPFGRRLMHGVVLGGGAARPDLRPVLAVVGSAPIVPAPVLALAEWTARTYVSSVGEALAVATPWDALWQGLRLEGSGKPPAQASAAVHAIAEQLARRPLSLRQATRLLAGSPHVIEELAATGMLSASTAVDRASIGRPTPEAGVPPAAARSGASGTLGQPTAKSRADTAIAEAFARGQPAVVVAGSNRVPAYLYAMTLARERGWSCVAACASVDAAETLADASAHAGLAPVVLHGALPPVARAASWRALARTQGAVVIGTRAAVFAPVAEPTLIIVDDEDSSGHKEERAPRYVAGVVAAHRAAAGGMLVLGATTPPAATYAEVMAGRARLAAVPSPRPRLGVIDLRRRADVDAPLSRPARDAARRVARRGGRVVVLADRKGYAGGLHCSECGSVVRCPQCGVAMPYDRAQRRLICRVCGRTWPAPRVCARCGAPRLRLLGAGTERLAATLRRHAPRVWRFDAETAADGARAAEILAAFREHGGVLVATTLVVSHLAALRPHLVVVTAADRWLHRPEFRAAERALALLREIGIAARAQVLVETADPDHAVITAAQAPSLRPFYAAELALRRDLGYPPYRVLASVVVRARTAETAETLVAHLTRVPGLEVLGSTPRSQPESRRVARYAVIKAADRQTLAGALWAMVTEAGTAGARLTVDVDPIDL